MIDWIWLIPAFIIGVITGAFWGALALLRSAREMIKEQNQIGINEHHTEN